MQRTNNLHYVYLYYQMTRPKSGEMNVKILLARLTALES